MGGQRRAGMGHGKISQEFRFFAVLVGLNRRLPNRVKPRRHQPENGELTTAAFCPAPKTSLLRMKRRIYGQFLPVCSLEPHVSRAAVLQGTPESRAVAFGAERPCFEGVEPCESSYGIFPTEPSGRVGKHQSLWPQASMQRETVFCFGVSGSKQRN